MRHPGAPSERELVDEVVRLRAINADLLEACEGAITFFKNEHDYGYDDELFATGWEFGEPLRSVFAKLETAVARAKGEVGG